MHSIEKIFKSYYQRLCHFAWQLTDDKTIIEDLVQDAFTMYWRNMDKIADHDIAIKNFLYTAVRNACYNQHKHQKVKARYALMHQQDPIEDPQLLGQIIRSEVLANVYQVIQTMPSACQEVFRLGYLEGISNPEIAKQLNISINTVKTQKQRGLKILREGLNPELFLLISIFLIP